MYPYYHCRKGCPGVAARKGKLETAFVDLLDSLRPRPEYLALFKAIVLDVWKEERRIAAEAEARLRTRVAGLEADLKKVMMPSS